MVKMKKHPTLGIMVRSDGLILHPGHYFGRGKKAYNPEYWTKGSYDKDGYLFTTINKKRYRIHRLVAETFLENIKDKQFVDHINRIRDDNNVENLRWVTQAENNNNTARSLPIGKRKCDMSKQEYKNMLLRKWKAKHKEAK